MEFITSLPPIQSLLLCSLFWVMSTGPAQIPNCVWSLPLSHTPPSTEPISYISLLPISPLHLHGACESLIIVYLSNSNTHPPANPPASNLHPVPSNWTCTLLASISLKQALDVLLHHFKIFHRTGLLMTSTANIVACLTGSSSVLKGFRAGVPKMCYFRMWIFLSIPIPNSLES